MENLFAIKHSYLIPLLPLIGAMISGFLGARWLKAQSHWPIWIGVGISAILSFLILFGTIGQLPGHSSTHEAISGHAGAERSAAPDSPASFSSESHTVGYNKVFFNWVSAGNWKEKAVLDSSGAPVLDKNGNPKVESISGFNAEAG